MITSKRALVCAPRLPEFDREAGSRRLSDLIAFLKEDGWSVSFVAEQADGGERYVRDLEQRGVATYVGFTPQTERLIESSEFAVALLTFWNVAEKLIPVLRRLSPATRVIVDSVDLHFVRNARRVFHRMAVSPTPGGLDAGYGSDMVRELNSYAAADAVLTVSDKESVLVNELSADSNLAQTVPQAEDLPLSPILREQRWGILFLGNFRHAPNIGGVEYLCDEIVPRLAPELLEQHPLYVVGNAPTDAVRRCVQAVEHARFVGWVPSVLPYLNNARITVVPLRYGAGTKRKLLESLMVGTPCVSTSAGIEGLDLTHGEHVLIADDPERFASAIERLLTDSGLWQHLAARGREHIMATHSRERARARLREVLASVLGRPCKPLLVLDPSGPLSGDARAAYRQLIGRIRKVVGNHLPAEVSVIVVSKGDEELLQLGGLRGMHFPQTQDGRYAGHYPSDGLEAVAHLEQLRARGGQYLLFPATAFWWLDHYAEFREHLDAHYRRVWCDADCIIYGLSRSQGEGDPAPDGPSALSRDVIERLRPTAPQIRPSASVNGEVKTGEVLALGIYLAFAENNVDDIVLNLSTPGPFRVTQRWIGLGGDPPTERVASVTVRKVVDKTPKFQLVNDLIASEDLSKYDYVVLFDDDIVLPDDFLSRFLSLQGRLGFSLAQPARTSNSYIDHPIVEQQRGVIARQTLFVEIGPVVSIHRSCYGQIFPFDLTSSMGWGYENVWSYRLTRNGFTLGIIDALPVDHSLREPVAHYRWSEANSERTNYLRKNPHYTYDECFRVLNLYGSEAVR